MPKSDDLVQEVKERRRRSERWLASNYYDEWVQAFRAYKCEREAEVNDKGQADQTQTSVGMPMTYSLVRRSVARNTAQIPNLRYHAKDPDTGELISRTLMYQWDKGNVQRVRKRHYLQAAIFGWSVLAWYWAVEDHQRRKRVNPFQLGPADAEAISNQYGVPPEALVDPMVIAQLLATKGKGRTLPIEYVYRCYEGPKCDFLSITDCFPEPNFQALQSSAWFCVQRRRRIDWLEDLVKLYSDKPEVKKGVEDLLRLHPRGSDPKWFNTSGADSANLRQQLLTAVSRTDDLASTSTTDIGVPEWTITEMHMPGRNPTLTFVGEDSVFMGQMPYPYDLEGRIAFTELLLIDDLLAGIGDSTARIIRGIQQLHDRQVNKREDLIDNLLRPIIGTTNREFYENPGLLKRHKGFRLVMMRGPGDLWYQPEQAAIAAAAASANDESGLMRLYQMATGDTNLSMASGVDPQQGRTATGARIMQANLDILTKDQIDMGTRATKEDAEMMFMLNRSEMSDEGFEFDENRYARNYQAGKDLTQASWVKVEPALFQIDGEITAEAGSMLADDDEAKVTKATTLFQNLRGDPLVNPQMLVQDLLTANGKGRQLSAYMSKPGPPPPPEIKTSLTIAAKLEMLDESVQQVVGQHVAKVFIAQDQATDAAAGPQPGEPPPGPPQAGMEAPVGV